MRTGSLITTVFGDAIAPRGGSIWLGSLISLMSEFGIGERLVRTSVYRLTQDGWLQSTQIGRRSYYSLSDDGRERFQQATHKIYGEPAAIWDGHWCLLLLHGLDVTRRDNVRKELGWLGFGALASNVLAHPSPDAQDLAATLARLQVTDAVIVMRGQTVGNTGKMRELVQSTWNLDDIERRYAGFIKRFRPLIASIGKNKKVAARAAFVVRTLLIQEYRKVLLRDPQLPVELLPSSWHGTDARHLCRNLYRAVCKPADGFLSATVETAHGPLPSPDKPYFSRFGGLE